MGNLQALTVHYTVREIFTLGFPEFGDSEYGGYEHASRRVNLALAQQAATRFKWCRKPVASISRYVDKYKLNYVSYCEIAMWVEG